MALRAFTIASITALVIALGACQDGGIGGIPSTRHLAPVPQKTLALMAQKGMSQNDPIVIRAFKKEAEMEVWKRGTDGRYALLKTFPICRWSGQLGPKTKQGDRQAPEGFYTVTPGQMNPNSSYYLSFDTGYPNAFDRANGRTGNYIMVHGTCSSAGCFAMTDESMAELYALARDSFAGGQRAFQFQSYPFRMTAQNVAKHRSDPHTPFWRNLKEGSDYFEALGEEPRVGVCGSRYVFGGPEVASGSCTPKVETLVAEKRERDDQAVAELIAKGTPATRVVYEDGGQNPVFRAPAAATAFASLGKANESELAYDPKEFARRHLGEVSRPETLAAAGREIEVDAKGRPIMMASAEAPIPTKAAAAAASSKAATDRKSGTRTATPAPEPVKAMPARVMVADADGDPSAYAKLLGGLFSNGSPTPATPATDAATMPAASAVAVVKPVAKPVRTAAVETVGTTAQAAAKDGPTAASKPAVKAEGRSEPKPAAKREGKTEPSAKPVVHAVVPAPAKN